VSGRGAKNTELADAAAAKLRTRALAEYLDEWEAQHGTLTSEELAAATAQLGIPAPSQPPPPATAS